MVNSIRTMSAREIYSPMQSYAEAVGIHLSQPAPQFKAMGDKWEILEPPQPKGIFSKSS